MKTLDFYMCGTQWSWECDDTYSLALDIFTSIKALKEHCKCWKECGIIHFKAGKGKYIIEPKPPKFKKKIKSINVTKK